VTLSLSSPYIKISERLARLLGTDIEKNVPIAPTGDAGVKALTQEQMAAAMEEAMRRVARRPREADVVDVTPRGQ
jgi:hypothetical protein